MKIINQLTNVLGIFSPMKWAIIGLLASALLGAGWYVQHTIKENARLELQLAIETKNLESLKADVKLFNEVNKELNSNLSKAREQATELADKFNSHDFEALLKAKPGLLEDRINNATKEAFNELEDLSR